MFSILTVCILISYLNSACGTERPVIGILAQEIYSNDSIALGRKSYISASYVKAVEATGARVVPVMIDKDVDYYIDIARSVNGFLFPGGSADIMSKTGYARAGEIIFNIAQSMNIRGEVMPIMGVCLGMELLSTLSAEGVDQRTPCQVRNDALSLKFLNGYWNSSLYSQASDRDIETLSKYNSTSNHHRYCITEETLSTSGALAHWKILSTSEGPKGDVFISSMESVRYPIVAIIFHPEKNAYEWKSTQANPHDARSIAAARLFYDWLTAQARRSNHSFATAEQVMDSLIENYNPVFTGKLGKYDFQKYYFS